MFSNKSYVAREIALEQHATPNTSLLLHSPSIYTFHGTMHLHRKHRLRTSEPLMQPPLHSALNYFSQAPIILESESSTSLPCRMPAGKHLCH